jgi:protein TIF31
MIYKLLMSLFILDRYFGQRSMKVAMNYHLVARTHSCRGDFRAALQSEKEAYAIYKQTVRKTKSFNWYLKSKLK